MYDRQTRSFWSTLEGVLVTGKLVGFGLRFKIEASSYYDHHLEGMEEAASAD